MENVIKKELKKFLDEHFMPAALLVTNLPHLSNQTSTESGFDIKSILDNGFTWYCPTPKHRTTAEKK